MRVFFLCFTSQNEKAKSSLMPALMTPLITMQWQPLDKSGIVLFRLMVAVWIRVKTTLPFYRFTS